MKFTPPAISAAMFAVCGIGILTAGCGGGGGGTSQTGSNEIPTPTPTLAPTPAPSPTPTPLVTSRLRVLHVSPDAGYVDVFIDSNAVLTGVPYKAVSTYLTLASGSHTVKMNAAGTSTALVNESVTMAANTDYTFAAAGDRSTIAPLVLTDDNSEPPAGTGRLRALQTAPNAGAVDFYVTGEDTDISTVSPSASSIGFKSTSNYIPLPAGTYRIRMTNAGTKNVIVDGDVTLASGQIRTAAAVGDPSVGQQLEAIVLADR